MQFFSDNNCKIYYYETEASAVQTRNETTLCVSVNEADFFSTTCTADTDCDTAAHQNAVCATLNVALGDDGNPDTMMRCQCPDGFTFTETDNSTGVCGRFHYPKNIQPHLMLKIFW